jgi:MoaA/NifB/PqqE/SkfB family radical SAM enzyme
MEKQGYLKFGEFVKYVHETPEGGWIVCTNGQTIDFSKLLKSDRKSLVTLTPLFPVNRTALEFMKLCDGSLTVEEIKGRMASRYRTEVAAVEEALGPFVQLALKAKHLDLTFYRDPQNIRVTGSAQYYLPLHAAVEVTSRCNFRCRYCYRSAEHVGTASKAAFELTTDQSLAMLSKLAEAGVGTMELTGGEPLLHPGILEIIKFCGAHFNLCALLTNGSTVTEKAAQALADAGNFVVGISIDGPNEQVVDESAGCRGVYARVRRGFELLAKHQIVSRAAMTVTPETVDYVEETLRLAQEWHASAFSAAPLMSMGRAKETSGIDLEFYRQFICNWHRAAKGHSDYVLKSTDSGRQYAEKCGNCGAGWRSLVVGPTGDVRFCLTNHDQWSLIGNLLCQDLAAICASPKVRFFRNLHWPDEKVCGDCDQYWYCGRCAMRGISTALEHKPDCRWAQESGVWNWVPRDGSGRQPEAGGCSRAYLRKTSE